MFRPSRRGGGHRFVSWQLALFFLAALVWLVGVVIDVRRLTDLSIVLLLAAIALGMVGRRKES